jgi:hypothetical protein
VVAPPSPPQLQFSGSTLLYLPIKVEGFAGAVFHGFNEPGGFASPAARGRCFKRLETSRLPAKSGAQR